MKGGRPRVVTDAHVARWISLYREGLSTRAIAAREAVSYGCVIEYLHRAAVPLRPAGRPRRFHPRVVREAAQRLGVRGAARELGCSVATVYRQRDTGGGA